MKHRIIAGNGSVAHISDIPQGIRDLYKTVWEIKQRDIIDMAAQRGPFICQSQSMNVHMANPNFAKLGSMHFYAWKSGLKTGMYYLRSNAAVEAIKFTVDKDMVGKSTPNMPSNTSSATPTAMPATPLSAAALRELQEAEMACSLDDPNNCISCSG
jgi:ribonucleoside-diphosphate reductase alpha chain